jgi:hypothetical protein
MLNLETGLVDIAATNDSALVGISEAAYAAADLTAGTSLIRCIEDPDAVYSVVDNNARLKGATLDLATGGAGVAASNNVDLIVVETSSATEPTLVQIAHGEHYTN